METVTVGIREFRDNLATYILESQTPIAITRHGDTVGLFIPTRRKRTEAQKEAFKEAAARVDKMMADLGITEEDILEDLKAIDEERKRKGRK
jgi:hypothetical protein